MVPRVAFRREIDLAGLAGSCSFQGRGDSTLIRRTARRNSASCSCCSEAPSFSAIFAFICFPRSSQAKFPHGSTNSIYLDSLNWRLSRAVSGINDCPWPGSRPAPAPQLKGRRRENESTENTPDARRPPEPDHNRWGGTKMGRPKLLFSLTPMKHSRHPLVRRPRTTRRPRSLLRIHLHEIIQAGLPPNCTTRARKIEVTPKACADLRR